MENNTYPTEIKIGATVRMNSAYLQTLSSDERKRESRRRYRVVRLNQIGDTTTVHMVDGRNRATSTTAGWLR
jgi:hypothetical protein